MNTNDFSKCKVGTKLWDHVRGCEGTVDRNEINENEIIVKSNGNGYWFKKRQNPIKQKLFFGKPEIIAPPEPVCLPDYKQGQWIAVWADGDTRPNLLQFIKFLDGELYGNLSGYTAVRWKNHCTLSELPEVLAKWGEK